MGSSLIGLLTLAGALGLFIFGMKQMSDGLQKVAGSAMRKVLASMTGNPLLGILTGFIVTALVQSSSASSVMVVSFVNAGLLTLSESIALTMGANIGTTITAWLVSAVGFRANVAMVALPIIAIGVPLMFSSKANLNAWAQALIGFALLFLGFSAMVETVPAFAFPMENPLVYIREDGLGIMGLLLFAFVGIVLTLIAQSSSAAMALTIVFCHQGWLTLEMGAAMVLGENIGTTITANLAAISGNVHAKRAARAHLIFNVIGTIWMVMLLPLFLKGIETMMLSAGGGSPFHHSEEIPLALSIFHSTFNVLNVLLLVWFIPQIARLVTRLQPAQGDENFHLEFIGKGLVQTAEISLHEAQKEIVKFAEIDRKGVNMIHALINETEPEAQLLLMKKLQKYEEITDRIELEVDRFLTQLSTAQLSEASSQRVHSMLVVVNHLESIGDIFYQMSKSVERKSKKKLWFDQQQRDELNEMHQLVDRAVMLMIGNIERPAKDLDLTEAVDLEKQINTLRHALRAKNFKRIEKGRVKLETGLIYNDLISGFEKIGDNLFQVSEALKGNNLA
jgi:phosphate:Na+ symporter